jgi:hypothetical protein
MKQDLFKGLLILLSSVLCAVACKKTSEPLSQATPSGINQKDTTLQITTDVPYPVTPTPECSYAPNYGDSIVYPEPVTGSSDYYVYPQNNTGVSGTYLSWPSGLVLDSKSGAIDLTQSETGARYSVAFVKSGTTDTCMSQLIVAGAAYMDSVYVLAQSDTTSKPYFNADPNGPPVCVGNQGPGCKFDYNNFAHNQGIEVDQKTGFIDLQKTMKNNAFGLIPLNGATIFTTIYYQLDDNSNFASQQIQLKLMYYDKKSDIPSGTLVTVADNIFNTLNYLLLSKGPKTRPPLIIIVRQN